MQIPIGKEIQAKHRREDREGPAGAGDVMHPFQKQQGAVSAVADHSRVSEISGKLIKQIPVKIGGTVGVGVRQRRFVRSPLDSQVMKLPEAAFKPVTDFPEGVGAREMTEEHRHKLRPAREALRMLFGVVLRNHLREFRAGEDLKELTKEAGSSYH